jgi:uncharacterized protein (TIRG00374 family)
VNIEKFEPLLDINGYLLVVIALLNILSFVMNGLFTQYVLRVFKKTIKTSEAIYLSVLSSVGNFFTPAGGGFGLRAVYLKRKHSLPYTEYISLMFGNYLFVFLVSSLFGVIALAFLHEKANLQYWVLVTFFVALFGLSVVLMLGRTARKILSIFSYQKIPLKARDILGRIASGWQEVVAHKILMFQLMGITFANLIITTLIVFTEIKALGLEASLPALLLFSILGSLSLFVSITPANLGVKEAVYIFSSQVLGFSIDQILLIALIDRGVLFATLVGFWLVSPNIKRKYGF